MSQPNICVVHLVRQKNGLEPLNQFLTSYRKHPAGVDHALLVLFKGFSGRKVPEEYESALREIPHERMHVDDRGFDITPYFKAAESVHADYFCFLNSFSIILGGDWLTKLYHAITRPGVGVAGATGSYQGISPDWRATRDAGDVVGRSAWKQKILNLPFVARMNTFRHSIFIPYFPNPHVRTNAFMLGRETMLLLRPKITTTKSQAYRFESGKAGMTRQILEMGKTACVVGSDGNIFGMEDWKESNTFWISEQQNLLISDNQTRRYQQSEAQSRRTYTWFAWGEDSYRQHDLA